MEIFMAVKKQSLSRNSRIWLQDEEAPCSVPTVPPSPVLATQAWKRGLSEVGWYCAGPVYVD